MSDHYTKIVLTVIAAALLSLAVQNMMPNANAQLGGSGCGTSPRNACYIATAANDPLDMRIVNTVEMRMAR